MVLLIS